MSEQLDLRAGASLILQQFRARWRTLGTALFFALVWSSARVALPILTGKTIDEAIGGQDKTLLLTFALAIVGVAAVQGLAAAVRRYFAMSTSYRVEANLRAELYDQVNQLSLDYHDRTSTGQLMSRASADLHEIQMFAVVIPLNTAFFLIAVGAFAVLLTVHVPLALAAMLAYPIITLLSARFFRRLSPAAARVQQDLADITHVVEENIAGVRTVRSFGREDDEVRKLQAVADRTFDDSMEAARLRTIYTPLFSWLPAISQLVILSFGGYLVLEGQLTAGEFVAFFQYLNMLIFPVQSLGELVPSGQRAMTSAARVWNVLRQRPTVAGTPHAGPMPEGDGDLVFASFDGASWTIETVVSDGDVGKFSSLAFDAAGRPHISFYDDLGGSSGRVLYAVRDGDAWAIEEVGTLDDVEQGMLGTRRNSSLALDAQGVPPFLRSQRKAVAQPVSSLASAGWRPRAQNR